MTSISSGIRGRVALPRGERLRKLVEPPEEKSCFFFAVRLLARKGVDRSQSFSFSGVGVSWAVPRLTQTS